MTIYGRSEELVSRCVECDLAEPESLASLGGSAPGVVDGILSNDQDMVESSDDNDDDEYVPEDEDANESHDAGDEDTPHDYNYDEMGSIGSEYNEPMDGDAIDMGDVGMNTHVDVKMELKWKYPTT